MLMLDYLSRFRVRFLTREFFLSQRILVFEYDKRDKEPTFTGISTSDTETRYPLSGVIHCVLLSAGYRH
jgi:hypothetical protein